MNLEDRIALQIGRAAMLVAKLEQEKSLLQTRIMELEARLQDRAEPDDE